MNGWGGIGWLVAAGLAAGVPLVAQDGGAPRPEAPADARLPAASALTEPAVVSRGPNERAERTRPRSAAANPLAPFLERWLSPRDSAGRKAAAPGLPPPPSGDRPPPKPAPGLSGRGQEVPTNPYLEAMSNLAPDAAGKTLPRESAPASPPPSLASSSTADDARVVAPTLTAPEAPERRPDPAYRPPPSPDAKYFPQQKRF